MYEVVDRRGDPINVYTNTIVLPTGRNLSSTGTLMPLKSMPLKCWMFALTTVALALGAFGQANAPSSSSSFQSSSYQDPSKIIQFLSSSVSWYRDRASEQKLATEPSDLGYIQENSRLADQVVQQAFEYARSEEQLRNQQRTPQPAPSPQAQNSQYERLN